MPMYCTDVQAQLSSTCSTHYRVILLYGEKKPDAFHFTPPFFSIPVMIIFRVL